MKKAMKKEVKGGTLEFVSFDLLPRHDSTWGLCTGRDGNIYLAACGEGIGGLTVFLLRYIPETRTLEYLIEVGPHIGELPEHGRASQSKIHYCLIPGSDGLLYCATHASGPPLNQPTWRPWSTWHDPKRWFTGSYIFTYDPRTNRIENVDVGPKKEGSRAMALDEKRRVLYGITWPRNHLYAYFLDERRYEDLGRIGDVNPQAIFLDRDGNAYTTDDYGFFLKVDAETLAIRGLRCKCPHTIYHSGWHNVPYDVVPAPDWSCFYGTDYGYESRLWRFDPYAGPDGHVEDLGRAYGPPELKTEPLLEFWQVRGLVFGMDGKLYMVTRLGSEVREEDLRRIQGWDIPRAEQNLIRCDVKTGERELLGTVRFDDFYPRAIASATPDFYGNLYFASAGFSPTGFFVYRPHNAGTQKVFGWKDIKQWG